MKSKLNILVLEDDRDDIIILKEMFVDIISGETQDPDYEYIFMSSLKEGVDYLSSGDVDVIILDLSLPDSFRLNTLRNLKKIRTPLDVPIIVLTSLDDKETGIDAVKMGAQEYLVKGQINSASLNKSIRYAIERHRLKTQLKNETDILKHNEEQLIKIITGDPDGVFIVDETRIVRFINPAAEKMLYRSRKQYLGKPFDFPIPEDDNSTSEIEIAHKHGETTIAEMRSVRIEYREELAWLVSIRDISKKKKLMNALAEEKERLLVTIRSIADGVISADDKGIIKVINWVACDMTGWPQEEALGSPLTDVLKIIDRNSGQSLLKPSSSKTAGQDVFISTGSADWILITRDNTEIPIEFSSAPIRKQNDIMGSVWVIRDVTEKKELEEESLHIQNLEALGVLAGGIAHEYNNILTSTLGYVSLAQNKITDDEKNLGRLKKIEQAALRAKEISSRLLTFSKGGEPLKRIEPISRNLKSISENIIKHPNINLVWSIPDDIWLVNFDADQVHLALKNILKNSEEAMPEGGQIIIKLENIKIPDIKFTNIKRGNYVKISVSDEGTGIPHEFLKKIFDPYFTTKEKAEGMGLTTAYSIIRRHGGWIRIKSPCTHGTGTLVTILLPAIISPSEREKLRVTPQKIEWISAKKGKVLIMDDEEFIREVAAELLNALDYDTETAESGEDAIHAYLDAIESGEPFDAVILDLVIPTGMGGKECIKKLLEIDPNVKAIVSSGYSNDPVIANYQDYGFCGVLPKPYQLQELNNALEKLK